MMSLTLSLADDDDVEVEVEVLDSFLTVLLLFYNKATSELRPY